MFERAIESLAGALLPAGEYKPLPVAFSNVAASDRASLISHAEELLNQPVPFTSATRYMDFWRDGNRTRYEDLYFPRRSHLATFLAAEALEGKGRFLDAITDYVWAICDECSWVIPAHNNHRREPGSPLPDFDSELPYIDLFSAETADILAWSARLFGDKLDEAVARRVKREVERRVFEPYLRREDMFWMGFAYGSFVNNWNPWINSSILGAVLLIEDDQPRRVALTEKILRSVEHFVAGYAPDGGCDEGPSYFSVAGASFIEVLELLCRGTGGKMDFFGEPIVRNMAEYIMHVHIADGYYVDFADSPARMESVAAGVLYRAARRMGDAKLEAFARWSVGAGFHMPPAHAFLSEHRHCFYRKLRDLLEPVPPAIEAVASLGHYFEGIQVCVARREENSVEGMFFAAKGGTNGESHNHNDVGSFIVYMDGEPAIVDAGVGTYTKKTFSPQRYDLWYMKSEYHAAPIVNGLGQLPGRERAAKGATYADDGRTARFSLDIAGAYPELAGITSYERAFEFDRANNSLAVRDVCRLARADEPVAIPLLLAGEPALSVGRADVCGLSICYDPEAFEASCEEVPLDDGRLSEAWRRERLYRLLLKRTRALKEDEFAITVKSNGGNK